MNEKELEQNTINSIKEAQLLEFAIMLLILDEFEKVAKGGNQSQSTNNIRSELTKEVDKFQKAIEISILATLQDLNKSTLNGLKGANDIKYYDVAKHGENMLKNVQKYVKSKGFVLNGQRLETFFYNLCRDEATKVVNGEIMLEEAIKKACHKLGQSGVSVVTYENTTRKIDVYVRQELLYAQKQSYQDIQFKYASDNDITVFETDAHPNARPSHQVWQGRRWDTTGKLYPTFEELSHGNGDYNDYNCLHVVDPVANPDAPLRYTEKDLANINTKPFNFRGKTYDGYEAKQHMRYLERQIRACKRENNLLSAKGLEDKKLSQKLKNLNVEYNQFCKVFGTYPRTNRLSVYTD